MNLNALRINLLELRPIRPHRRMPRDRNQTSLPLRPFTANLSIHRQTPPFSHRWRLSVFAGFEEFDGCLWGEAFVVVVVHLDHGGVGAGAEAFDFAEGEETVGGGLGVEGWREGEGTFVLDFFSHLLIPSVPLLHFHPDILIRFPISWRCSPLHP